MGCTNHVPPFFALRCHRKAPGDLSLGYDALSAKVPSPPLCLGDCPLESLSASSSSSDLPRPRCLRQAGGLQGSTHIQTHHYIITWQVTAEKKKTERWREEKKVVVKKKKKMARERMSNTGCRITLFPRQETARPPPGVHSICPHTFFLMAYRKDALRIFLLHHPRHSSTELKSHRKLLSFTLQDKYSHFPCTSNVHTRY